MELFQSDWPAWIALAAAILSPILTIFIDKLFLYLSESRKEKRERQEAIALLISEILRASCHKPGDPPTISSEAGKALAYCSEKTARYVVSYFSLWPDYQVDFNPSETPLRIFDKEDVTDPISNWTIRTTTQKLIEMLTKESGCKRAHWR